MGKGSEQSIHRGKIQMTNNCRERYSASPGRSQLSAGTTERDFSREAKINQTDNVLDSVGKWSLSETKGGRLNWPNHLEKQNGGNCQNLTSILFPGNSTSRNLSYGNAYVCQ